MEYYKTWWVTITKFHLTICLERVWRRLMVRLYLSYGVLQVSTDHILSLKTKVSKRGSLKTALQSAPETALQSAPETALQIITEIRNNPNITLSEIAERIGVSRRWIATNIKHLQDTGVVKRIGPNKGGHWEIIA